MVIYGQTKLSKLYKWLKVTPKFKVSRGHLWSLGMTHCKYTHRWICFGQPIFPGLRVKLKSKRGEIMVYSRSRSSKVSWSRIKTNLISGFMMDCIEAVSWFRFLSRLKFSTFFRWFRLFLIRFSCFSWRDLNEIVQNTKPVSFRIEKNLKYICESKSTRVVQRSSENIFVLHGHDMSKELWFDGRSNEVIWGLLGLKVIGRKE